MNKIIKITLIVLSVILIIAIAFGVYSILDRPNIYNGVKIEGVNAGNLSKEEMEKKLKDKFDEEMKNKEILFKSENYSKAVSYRDLGIEYNYSKAIEKAHKVGRNGNIFARLKDIADVSFNDRNINLETTRDDSLLEQAIGQISEEVTVEKKEATITYYNGGFAVTDDVTGISVDVNTLKKDVKESIDKSEIVEIPIKKDLPAATREELEKVKEEVGTYSTTFSLDDANRVFNVKRASDSIDDKLLLPGEVFSFNKATGPRSFKAGYKEATVILNGEFVPGEGGGVCQVSSTLYNTLLSSGVDVVERHKHTLPVTYVPLGKDATVAYDFLDLKFKNNYAGPIYIKSYVNGNTLTIKMYGSKNLKP